MSKLYDRRSRDLTAAGLVLAVVLLCAARLVLASFGRLYLEPENSPIDDQLMYNAAVSITNGQWLGPYAYNTVAKQMFFSVWLAFIHWLGLPYLVANAALGLAGAWVMAAALRPVLQKRLWVLGAFFLLAYCPVGFDQYNYRVYRDSITIPLMLLAVGGIAGAVLRLALPGQQSKKAAPWLYAAVGGLGLGASWLNREDGVWLLPFFCCFALIGALVLLKKNGLRKSLAALACLCLPFALLAGCLTAYAGMNYKYYGRFILSDLTSKDFTTAYGLLVGIEDPETGACRPISQTTRKKLYQNSEFFAALEPYWEAPRVMNAYGNAERGVYGGSFYYGMRLANQFAGQYVDPLETKAFYEQMAEELLRLEAQGVISIPHKAASTVPYWRAEYLVPTVKELGNGLWMALTCDTFASRPRLSVYSKVDLVAQMLDYLGGDIVRGYAAGTDKPYQNPLHKLAADVLCWAWRILILPAVAAGLWFAFAGCKKGFGTLFGKKKLFRPDGAFWAWVLVWGLVLSGLLRCALMAYMEVTVFGIGTYLMYVSTAVPLFGLAGFLGVSQMIRSGKNGRENGRENGRNNDL